MNTRIRHISAAFSLVTFCLILGATTASAQTDPAAAAAQQPPPDPSKMKTTSTAILGFTRMSGPVEMTQFNANGEVTSANDVRSFSLQADHSFGKTFGLTSSDTQHVKFTVRQDVSSHTYFLARPSFERNKIQSIDHQYEELVGFGFWAGNARGRLDIVPVAGFIQQKKNIEAVDGNHFTAGILQIATAQLNAAWNVSQSFVYMRNTGAEDDSRLQANVSLSGNIAGPLALNLSYSAEHDNIILETVGGSKTTQTFTVGIQLQFPRP